MADLGKILFISSIVFCTKASNGMSSEFENENLQELLKQSLQIIEIPVSQQKNKKRKHMILMKKQSSNHRDSATENSNHKGVRWENKNSQPLEF